MKNTSLSIVALASVASALTAMPASAQELQRGETVLQRPRPEVEQLGVRAGSFVFLPRLEVGETYDSNVFLTENNTQSDWVFVARPSLDVRSDFSSHALNFSASADAGRYHEFSSENYTDYRVGAGGRFDVARETAVSGDVFHRRLHEGRNDPDGPIGTVGEPIVYNLSGGEVALAQGFNRIRTRLSAQAGYYDFESQANDRDRWEYGTSLRVGYDLGTGYQPFVQGTYAWTNYENAARDADGWELVAGTTFDLTGLITGEVYAGYMTRQYDNAALRDFSGLALGGQVNWAVTQLTTLSARASRHVRETGTGSALGGASSYTRTIGALGVDHELLRNLLLNGRLQWRQDDFRGIDRTDNVYTAGVGATYLINRYLYLTGGYTYETRRSDRANADYKDNLLFLRVGAQM